MSSEYISNSKINAVTSHNHQFLLSRGPSSVNQSKNLDVQLPKIISNQEEKIKKFMTLNDQTDLGD